MISLSVLFEPEKGYASVIEKELTRKGTDGFSLFVVES